MINIVLKKTPDLITASPRHFTQKYECGFRKVCFSRRTMLHITVFYSDMYFSELIYFYKDRRNWTHVNGCV